MTARKMSGESCSRSAADEIRASASFSDNAGQSGWMKLIGAGRSGGSIGAMKASPFFLSSCTAAEACFWTDSSCFLSDSRCRSIGLAWQTCCRNLLRRVWRCRAVRGRLTRCCSLPSHETARSAQEHDRGKITHGPATMLVAGPVSSSQPITDLTLVFSRSRQFLLASRFLLVLASLCKGFIRWILLRLRISDNN